MEGVFAETFDVSLKGEVRVKYDTKVSDGRGEGNYLPRSQTVGQQSGSVEWRDSQIGPYGWSQFWS